MIDCIGEGLRVSQRRISTDKACLPNAAYAASWGASPPQYDSSSRIQTPQNGPVFGRFWRFRDCLPAKASEWSSHIVCYIPRPIPKLVKLEKIPMSNKFVKDVVVTAAVKRS